MLVKLAELAELAELRDPPNFRFLENGGGVFGVVKEEDLYSSSVN